MVCLQLPTKLVNKEDQLSLPNVLEFRNRSQPVIRRSVFLGERGKEEKKLLTPRVLSKDTL